PHFDLRPPLTLSALHKMVSAVASFGWPVYTSVLIKAMLSTSFHAFLHPGEMTRSVNAISFQNTVISVSKFKLKLLSYKHSKGVPAVVKVKATDSPFCPVRALHRYIKLRGSAGGNLFCDVMGKPVSYQWYNKVFQSLVAVANLDPGLRPHSARIGAATHAAAQGVPEDKIKRMGRWVSSAYGLYIRLPTISL
ncbi:MAG: tyrosine-type recombinase/integrase, partial [Desulfobacterales bacterium]|nr:tyrosine-type recombinase/integrase [Desulfobacterales bacterium]